MSLSKLESFRYLQGISSRTDPTLPDYRSDDDDMTDFTSQIADHEERLTAVERRQDSQGRKLDDISRDIAAVRAEGNARAITATHGMDQLRQDLQSLARQIAENTGAQKRQNQLAEDSLRRWRKLAAIIGLLCTVGAAVGSTLLSDQEVASTIWVHWLHLREPWDMVQGGPDNASNTASH